MTELDQPVADIGGIKAEVFGIETLAPAPVTDAGGNEDSPAAYGVEKRMGLVTRVNGSVFWFGLGEGWKKETPARR